MVRFVEPSQELRKTFGLPLNDGDLGTEGMYSTLYDHCPEAKFTTGALAMSFPKTFSESESFMTEVWRIFV